MGSLGAEQLAELPGVRLEAFRLLLGRIEDAGDVLLFAGRYPEDLLEGVDLPAVDGAVNLGDLCTEHDDGDAERHLPRRLACVATETLGAGRALAERRELAA